MPSRKTNRESSGGSKPSRSPRPKSRAIPAICQPFWTAYQAALADANTALQNMIRVLNNPASTIFQRSAAISAYQNANGRVQKTVIDYKYCVDNTGIA